jgi:zinc transport system substrate-binding protein
MKKIMFLCLIIVLSLFLSGCMEQQTNEGLTIVTTIYPLSEFAKEVGGDKVKVSMLLPPGAEAHTYEPKPSDIVKINNADVFIYIGEEMEPWAEKILKSAKENLVVIEAVDFVRTIIDDEHEEENVNEDEDDEKVEDHEYDPHVWLDFHNNIDIVNAIALKLSELDEENEAYYKNNAQIYIKKLEILHILYESNLQNCDNRLIISAGHNIYGYLEERYDFESVTAYGLSPDSEPTPQDIKNIVDLLEEKNLKHVLFEEMVNPKLAQTMSKDVNAEILVFNPAANIGKDNERKTFIDIMQSNLEALKIAMNCN